MGEPIEPSSKELLDLNIKLFIRKKRAESKKINVFLGQPLLLGSFTKISYFSKAYYGRGLLL